MVTEPKIPQTIRVEADVYSALLAAKAQQERHAGRILSFSDVLKSILDSQGKEESH